MSAPDPLIGKLIGSIRIQAKLGAGAMGVVYRGRHDVLAKDVAVKILSHARGDQGHARQRFLREGQAAAKISHANVVQVFEAGVHQNTPYLVMELVVGHSLGSLLDEVSRKSGKPTGLPPKSVISLGTGIALGIQAIHAVGIVHRDIKPDNVMVSADRTPKVADLGLAKEVADPDALRLTGTGMVVGTPLYCAPEAIRDPQSIGPPADIYSLGATLFHMIAGRPPFEAPTAYEVMRAHLEDRPRDLRDLVPGTPVSLSNLVSLCLDKDPKRRPTALAVAEALGSGATLRARPRIGLAALVVLGVIAVGGGAGATWWSIHQREAMISTPQATGLLLLKCSHPHLRLRLDSKAWQESKPGGTVVVPGRHQLEVEAVQPGPLLRWYGQVDVAPSAPMEIPIHLESVPVPEVRLEFDGAGMLYVAGEALGLESAASVTFAGTWPLARWEGTQWKTLTYEVGINGAKKEIGRGGVRERPDGDAWWRRSDGDGKAVEPYHVICWWEAEQVRSAINLPEPPGWVEQGQRPSQPALKLKADLVDAVLARLGTARLPNKSQAAPHASRLNQPVWYRDSHGQPALANGSSATTSGSLVVFPDKQ
ncbi:MAG: serine/threonine-protein kinase [Planctomycetota bacterium]